MALNDAVDNAVDLSGTFAADLHSVLSDVAQLGPLASDVTTGATVVLRHRDVETLAHDQRLDRSSPHWFDGLGC